MAVSDRDRVLTAAEVAQRLGCSERKVYRLMHAGALGRVPYGKRAVRVRQADVDRYLHGDAPATPAAAPASQEASATPEYVSAFLLLSQRFAQLAADLAVLAAEVQRTHLTPPTPTTKGLPTP